MKIHLADTVVEVPDGIVDTSATVVPHPAEESPADSATPAQRTIPRISIDLGPGTEPGFPHQPGADLEVMGVLGEGGMGRVLLVRQHALRRDVAVKVLRPEAKPSDRAALLDEGAIVGSLEHPAIVPVHALGVDDLSRPVLVMKRIEGVTFRDLLRDPAHELWGEHTQPEQRLARSLEILMQVCNAVHFAHSRGVVHLDIKPGNVLVGHHGDAYLVDWGVARRLSEGSRDASFAGTPSFAAPEMVVGKKLDPRTDVYLLGATLHLVLTGEPRHRGELVREVLASAIRSEPYDYDESVPLALATLANRATARDPGARPESADAFRRALVAFEQHKSSTALTSSAIGRLAELWVLMKDLGREAEPEHVRRIDELAIEARFGLDQALGLWPGNSEAAHARAELERLFLERRERDRDMRRRAQDQDGRLWARYRIRVLAGLSVVGLTVSSLGVWGWWAGTETTARDLAVQSGFPTLAACLLALAFRRRLSASLPNRALMTVMVAATLSLTASRLLGLAAGSSVAEILTRDCLLVAATASLTATILSRWHLLGLPFVLASAALCALRPDLATLAFGVASGATLVVGSTVELATTSRAGRPANATSSP